MYWLLGGSYKTIPGFAVGAVVTLAVLWAIESEMWFIALFGGLLGETVNYWLIENRGN